MRFDIPVNLTVSSNTEQRAVNDVFDFMRKAFRDFGTEHNITEWDYVEFIAEEPDSGGCGDLNQEQRQCQNCG
jgi:hypothetical protein